MNEDAVQALKQAMEPPESWTARGRLSAREVMRRLEALGFTVARSGDVRTEPARPSGRGVLAGLMADLESNLAAVGSRRAERSQGAADSDSRLSDEQRRSA